MLPREARHDWRPRRPALRPLIRRAAALAAIGVALAAVGCGSDSDDREAANSAETSLEVTLDVDGEGGEAPRTGTVACQALVDCPGAETLGAADFEPLAPETPCTEIFGGPEIAMIAGRFVGEPVELQLSRANGCEIKRFDRFVGMLQALFEDYKPGQALAP